MPNRKLPEQDDFGALLMSEIEKERTKGSGSSARLLRLGLLLALHTQTEKTPHDGWKATLLAGRLGIPAPLWAIDLLETVERESIVGETNIAVALGFKGRGKGGLKKAPVQQAIQARLREELCYSVRLLVSSGKSLKSACEAVATKLKKTQDWNDTNYPLRRPNSDSLEKVYQQWEKDRGTEVLSLFDKGFDSLPREEREKFLAQFR